MAKAKDMVYVYDPSVEYFWTSQEKDKFYCEDAKTKPTNPKDRAATDRIDLSLFPDTAIVYGALGMTEGDCKYGGFNYRIGGVNASTYVAAAKRHLAKWYAGEEYDPKTLVPHLASVLSCIAILIDATECGVLNDDRPPKVDMESLIERMRVKVQGLQKLFPTGPERYTQKDNGILGDC